MQQIQSSAQAFSAEMEGSDSEEVEADERTETSGDLVCIICHQQEGDNPLGFIGFCQQSSLLHRTQEPLMHSHDPQADGRSETTPHLTFCGHVMHLSCFDPFFARAVQSSAGQENFMLDPSKGQYQCPLCKRINNILVPCYPVDVIEVPREFNYDVFINDSRNATEAASEEESSSYEPQGNISQVVRRVFSSFFQRLGMEPQVDAHATIPIPPAYSHGLEAINIRFLTCLGFVSGNQSNALWNAMEGLLKAIVYTTEMELLSNNQGSSALTKYIGHSLTALRACLKDADGILPLQYCVRSSVLAITSGSNLSLLLRRNISDRRVVEDSVSSWLCDPLLQRPMLPLIAIAIAVFSDESLYYHTNLICFASLVQIIIAELAANKSVQKEEEGMEMECGSETSKMVSEVISIVRSHISTNGEVSLQSVVRRWESYLEVANALLSTVSLRAEHPVVWTNVLPQLIPLWISKSGRAAEPIITSRSYSVPRLPQLLSLPNEYTELHRVVVSMFDMEFPAICLVCGAVINANGKGYCTKHVSACCGTAGVLFLVQDCSVLLMSDGRCCYFPSPYADKHGEKHKQYKGRPLYLDKKRYEAVAKLWTSHRIPNEVLRIRSSSSRVIIIGHY